MWIDRATFSKEKLKEESNSISIPSFQLRKNIKKEVNFKDFLKDTLILLFEKSHEKLLHKNNLESVNNILSERLFNNKNLHETIFEDIKKYLNNNWLTFQNLRNIEIRAGLLYVRLDTWKNFVYDLSATNIEDFIRPTTTKEDLNKLKEEQDVTTEIIMWGALVTLTYSQFVELWDWGDKAINKASRNFWNMKKQKFLKSIEVDDWKWWKFEVSLDPRVESFQNGKIGQIEIRNILKEKWIVFNPEKRIFEETPKRKLNKAVEAIEYKSIVKRINSYSYMEYKLEMRDAKIPISERLSEKEFEKAKKDNIKILKELNNDFNAWKNKKLRFWTYLKWKYFWWFFQKIGWKAIHVLMMPIFFKEIHKHSWNLDSYVKWWVEVAAFMTWAKYWGKIPWPALLKMISGILAWWAAAVWWEKLLHSADKQILAKMPNREDYFKRLWFEDSASFAWWLFWWAINDLADWLNRDIWINFNNVWLHKAVWLFSWDYSEKKGLDINIFNNNINLWTSVIEYLNERTRGVEHWNKEVEEFRIKATKEINTKILAKDFKYSDVFKDTNIVYYKHSFEENIYEWLNTVKRFKKEFLNDHWDTATKKIVEFSKANIPDDLLLWAFTDKNDIEGTRVFDKIKEKLKVFLKEKNILTKKEDIERFVNLYEGIFYEQINEKIDDILWNPSTVESLLWASWNIHNSTEKIKEDLAEYIKKWYFRDKLEKKEFDKLWHNNSMSHIEIHMEAEINKLKIDEWYIVDYKKVIENDKKLLIKALNWDVSIQKVDNIYFIEDDEWKFLPTTWNVSDIIYISKLSKEDRKFTKDIFDKILHPEKWMIFDWPQIEKNELWYVESLDHHSTMTSKQFEANSKMVKFEKLLENDKYFIFFNRMIDFKRRKVFIENVVEHWDSEEQVIRTSIVNKVSEILDWF